MNRKQRRAIAKTVNVSNSIPRAPWYVRGPARLMVAVGALSGLIMFFYIAAELLP